MTFLPRRTRHPNFIEFGAEILKTNGCFTHLSQSGSDYSTPKDGLSSQFLAVDKRLLLIDSPGPAVRWRRAAAFSLDNRLKQTLASGIFTEFPEGENTNACVCSCSKCFNSRSLYDGV